MGAAQCLKASGFKDALVDLGTALNIALTAGDGFSETIIEGGKGLLPAENSSWVTNLWALVRDIAQRTMLQE